MKIRGPFVTLGAVAALGVGILLVNMSKEEKAPQANPYSHSTTTAAAATAAPSPPAPSTPPPPAFPAKADYVGKIPTAAGTITVEITVLGDKAVAYACDGNRVESWLRGSASNGVVSLANKDKTSHLDGRLEGNAVVGTLWIGAKKWDFRAEPAQPPAGLYVYDAGGHDVRAAPFRAADQADRGRTRRRTSADRPVAARDGAARKPQSLDGP